MEGNVNSGLHQHIMADREQKTAKRRKKYFILHQTLLILTHKVSIYSKNAGYIYT